MVFKATEASSGYQNNCTSYCVPSSKESVEWVSMMGLDRGGFVLIKESKVIIKTEYQQ